MLRIRSDTRERRRKTPLPTHTHAVRVAATTLITQMVASNTRPWSKLPTVEARFASGYWPAPSTRRPTISSRALLLWSNSATRAGISDAWSPPARHLAISYAESWTARARDSRSFSATNRLSDASNSVRMSPTSAWAGAGAGAAEPEPAITSRPYDRSFSADSAAAQAASTAGADSERIR